MKLENITFNRDKKDFVAILSDFDKEYSLSLLDFEENEVEKATEFASEICSWLELNKQAARVFCTSTLLSLKNESWLEEGEAPMTNKLGWIDQATMPMMHTP